MYAIEIEHLTKSYGNFKAVDNLTLKVEEGTVFGFLGPNGAGKTTTILSMLGLIIPDEGIIRLLGHELRYRKAKTLLKGHETEAFTCPGPYKRPRASNTR